MVHGLQVHLPVGADDPDVDVAVAGEIRGRGPGSGQHLAADALPWVPYRAAVHALPEGPVGAPHEDRVGSAAQRDRAGLGGELAAQGLPGRPESVAQHVVPQLVVGPLPEDDLRAAGPDRCRCADQAAAVWHRRAAGVRALHYPYRAVGAGVEHVDHRAAGHRRTWRHAGRRRQNVRRRGRRGGREHRGQAHPGAGDRCGGYPPRCVAGQFHRHAPLVMAGWLCAIRTIRLPPASAGWNDGRPQTGGLAKRAKSVNY